jgi:hypothetical protein
MKIVNARLRQATRTHQFALLVTVGCVLPELLSALLMAVGRDAPSPIASAAGALPIISCLQFLRDANDRLDRLLSELKEDNDSMISATKSETSTL